MAERDRNRHQCEFCPRAFGSAIGLGVHQQHAHRRDYDLKVKAVRGEVKVRWTKEEVFLLASKEIELEGERFINIALAPHFPERTT